MIIISYLILKFHNFSLIFTFFTRIETIFLWYYAFLRIEYYYYYILKRRCCFKQRNSKHLFFNPTPVKPRKFKTEQKEESLDMLEYIHNLYLHHVIDGHWGEINNKDKNIEFEDSSIQLLFRSMLSNSLFGATKFLSAWVHDRLPSMMYRIYYNVFLLQKWGKCFCTTNSSQST